MSIVADVSEVIVAIGVIINAMQSFRNSLHAKKIIEEVKAVKEEVVTVVNATNGLQTKLLDATAQLQFAAGVKSAEDEAALKSISR